jgi:hypothetical protein
VKNFAPITCISQLNTVRFGKGELTLKKLKFGFRLKSLIGAALSLLFITALLSACGQKSDISGNNADNKAGQQQVRMNRNMKIAKIVSVSDGKIEVNLAKASEERPNPGEDSNNNRPEGRSIPDGQEPPDISGRPDRQERPGGPSGQTRQRERPDGSPEGGNRAGGFTGNREFSDEIVTLTLSDDVQILEGGEKTSQITASDLTSGSIIIYTEDNGKVTSIRIFANN